MEGRFIVPKRWQKGAWKSGIRTELDKKFPAERIESVFITSELKCLATTATLKSHDNPYNRIEFESEEHHHEYDIVPKKCNAVRMEV